MSQASRLLLLLAAALSTPAFAADWLTVASDRVRRVELDRASIMPSDAGTKVAWGRIVLSDEQAKAYGYRTVRALNRYDCRSHAFIIVKRVYMSADENVLREDKVEATAPISVKTGTVDDRFFNEVCKPPSVTDLLKTAKRAADGIAKAEVAEKEKDREKDRAQDKPMLRRADIQLTGDEAPVPVPAPASPKAPAMAANKSLAAPPDKALAKVEAHKAAPEHAPAHEMHAATASSSSPASTPAPATPAPALRAAEAPPPRQPAEQLAAERAAQHAAALLAHKNPPSNAMMHTSSLGQTRAAPTVNSMATPAATAGNSVRPDMRDLHWSYEGADGPENWGKLDPEFSVCSNGKRQSPIDIHDGIKVDQEPIQFDYKPTYFRIVDNGHTIQINYGAGSHITVMGRTYDLIQFHFHHPAEERIDGKGFAMVAHLVHRDPEGRLAVVAVLLEAGTANSLVQTLWNNLPLEKNEDYTPRVAIQAADLLPAKPGYISYIGSLTTPPCTEGVLWLVMKQPVQLSPEQIDVFTRFYPNNARPVQSASGRIIKESR